MYSICISDLEITFLFVIYIDIHICCLKLIKFILKVYKYNIVDI